MNIHPDNDDLITCEHCGGRFYPEVGMGHVCQQAIDAARRETEALNRKFVGSGKRIQVRIQIALECYDSPEAVRSALDCVELNSSAALNQNDHVTGNDDILDCLYVMERTVVPR